jgi:hypothetical protein
VAAAAIQDVLRLPVVAAEAVRCSPACEDIYIRWEVAADRLVDRAAAPAALGVIRVVDSAAGVAADVAAASSADCIRWVVAVDHPVDRAAAQVVLGAIRVAGSAADLLAS